MPFKRLTDEERLQRFHASYTVNPKTKCWEWNKSRNRLGYGSITDPNFKGHMAHRWSYTKFKGPITEGHLVLHSCDNPPCVNPAHLSTGTQQDNMDDAIRKGRTISYKKIRCIHGHEMSGSNIYREKRVTFGGKYTFYAKICRTCKNKRSREGCKRRRREAKERMNGNLFSQELRPSLPKENE